MIVKSKWRVRSEIEDKKEVYLRGKIILVYKDSKWKNFRFL